MHRMSQQKIIIGDDSGSLNCYEFKKGEAQVHNVSVANAIDIFAHYDSQQTGLELSDCFQREAVHRTGILCGGDRCQDQGRQGTYYLFSICAVQWLPE